jgi:drug/metabolite transporter (DMT)-like permease
MLTEYQQGELAALLTAFCWTVSSLCFSSAGRIVGSLSVNFIRLVVAFLSLCLIGLVARGLPLPTDASGDAWFWLGLSGFVGFFLGDLCLFKALVLLGARLTALVQAIVPLMTAAMAVAALDERLRPLNLLGMAVTLAGVIWVVIEQPESAEGAPVKHYGRGLVLGFFAALGQAVGVILSKKGLGSYDAFAATHIRVIAGLSGFLVLLAVLRWYPRVVRVLILPKPMTLIVSGSIAGPVVGVALLLWSIRLVPTGIASTITSTIPVIIIPFVIVLYKEKVSARAVLGAVVAVVGVGLLFL